MAKTQEFQPAGTPRQQECWLRNVERQLLREASSIRRRASKIDRLAAKIAESHSTGKPISRHTLADVVNCGEGAGRYFVAKLAGIDRYHGRDELIDGVLGLERHCQPKATAAQEATTLPASVEPTQLPNNVVPLFDESGMALARVRLGARETR